VSAKLAPDVPVETFANALISPGFIDTHVHYPQLDIIAGYGAQLMDWLQSYAFPAEERFADAAFARAAAAAFLTEMLRHGATSALVFATVHAQSADALFAAALKRNMRLITGKTLMDRNAPASLLDTPERSYSESKALIEKWRGQGRLSYAVTPRFAPTSSPEQLAAAGKLLREHPDCYLHTHMSENAAEIELVRQSFPSAPDYLGVYEAHGLSRERSVFAHSIHLSDSAWTRLGKSGASVAFCPSSNLFLGSGLFDLDSAEKHGVPVGLGTDVGAGTSLSLLAAMGDAYKVCQLRGRALDPFKSFYLATLGAARALKLDDRIGNLAPGKEADFVVLDLAATPMLERRLKGRDAIAEKLFALSILGDDRAVARTYVAGELAHRRDP
jgi:guanine deaminase